MKQLLLIFLLIPFASLHSQLTISEILYEGPTWNDDLQYIELLNYADTTVLMTDWSIEGDLNFSFGFPVDLPPGERFIISSFAGLGVITDFDLDIPLGIGVWPMQDQIFGTPTFVIRNPDGEEVARIEHDATLGWPVPEAGVSIELCDVTLDSNDGSNWALSTNSISDGNNELIGTPTTQNTCSMVNSVSIASDPFEKFRLFPNPCHSILNMNYSGIIESFEVYNANGIQMLKANDTDQIDISSLNTGVYNIILKVGDQEHYQRIIKI